MRENPVKDIHIGANTSLEDLISQFGEAGGFVEGSRRSEEGYTPLYS